MNDLLGLIKQCHWDSQRWFPDVANDARYQAFGMAGEVGEVIEHLKKEWRGSVAMDETLRALIAEEGVDVLIYLCNLFAVLGVNPVEIYKEKRAKNELRFGTGIVLVGNPLDHTGDDQPIKVAQHGRNEHWGAC